MSRGFVVCQYLDDLGTPWRLQVDADYAEDPIRGWVPALTPGLYPLPRRWEPRQVYGIADDGRLVFARCGTTTCDLWTGVALDFNFSGNDGRVYRVRRIGQRAEVRRN